jgi:hypothetical protein
MSEMFNGAEMFNQSLDNWNVRESRVELYNMFKNSLTRTPVPHWYNREREEDEYEEEEDEEELADRRRAQVELQRQIQAAQQAAEQSPTETQNYPECPICGDYLNNSDGPEPSDKCSINCKDVVNVCRNNHLLHRGCVLGSCGAGLLNVAGQIDSQYVHMIPMTTSTTCPICRAPLVPSCEGFKTKTKVANENIGKYGMEIKPTELLLPPPPPQAGGKRRGTKRHKRYAKHKTKKHKVQKKSKKHKQNKKTNKKHKKSHRKGNNHKTKRK